MRRTLLPVLLCLAGGAPAQTLDFKGIPFGSDSETVRSALYESIQNWTCDEIEGGALKLLADKICRMGDSTYAARPVTSLKAHFYDGKVGAFDMKISPDDYADIRDAVAERYGKPKEFLSKVTNAMGATFDQRQAIWALPNGSIRIERYTDKLTEGTVQVQSHVYTAEFERRFKARPKAKSDI